MFLSLGEVRACPILCMRQTKAKFLTLSPSIDLQATLTRQQQGTRFDNPEDKMVTAIADRRQSMVLVMEIV